MFRSTIPVAATCIWILGSTASRCGAADDIQELLQPNTVKVLGGSRDGRTLSELFDSLEPPESLEGSGQAEANGAGAAAPACGTVQVTLHYWDFNHDGQAVLTDVLSGPFMRLLEHLFRGGPLPSPVPVVFGDVVVRARDPAPQTIDVYDVDTDKLVATVPVCDGRFAVSLFPGNYRLETATGHTYDEDQDCKPDPIVVGAMGEVIGPVPLVRCPPPCKSLGGTVTCNGQPAAGATVVVWDAQDCWLGQRKTQTDESGNYCFPDLPAGSYKVYAYQRGTGCCGLCVAFHDPTGDGKADPAQVTPDAPVVADVSMATQNADLLKIQIQAPDGKPAGTVALVGKACDVDAPFAGYCMRADAAGLLEFALPCGVALGVICFWKDNDGDGDVDSGDFLGFLDLNGNGTADIPGDCLNLKCQLQATVKLGTIR